MSGVLAVDWWTLAHAGSGVALAVLAVGVWWAFGALVGFEVVESIMRSFPVGSGALSEFASLSNIIADVLVAVLAYLAIRAFLGSHGYRRHWTRRGRKWAV